MSSNNCENPEPLIFSSPGERLDLALARAAGVSRNVAQSWIAAGQVQVGGVVMTRSSHRLGQQTALALPLAPRSLTVAPEEIPFNLIFEDEQILVLEKPAGLATHPAPGRPSGTLVNALLFHLGLEAVEGQHPEQVRPGIVHRLDQETSGVMVVAKTPQALAELSSQFAQRQVTKTYLAIAQGIPRQKLVNLPIGRDPLTRTRMRVGGIAPREAQTELVVLAQTGKLALVQAHPHTGRTHQIRVHLQALGAPVLADPLYGHASPLINRLALHAQSLEFFHPRTGEGLVFYSPVPEDMVLAWLKAGGKPEDLVSAGSRASPGQFR